MSKEITLVPSVLYRYYKLGGWDCVFKTWTIRFSPFTEFNDPFEAMPAFKKIFSVVSCDAALIFLCNSVFVV